MLSSTCRHDGCEHHCTLLSVFCDKHHAEQLQRIGARIRPLSERFSKFWDLHCRGILTDAETVFSFLDNIAPNTVVSAFDDLPTEYQSLIAVYLGRTPPEALPRCVFVGPASQEDIDVATAERRTSAKVLQTHLTGR